MAFHTFLFFGWSSLSVYFVLPPDLYLNPATSLILNSKDKFQSKSKNSPFTAMELRGRVMRTMVAGRTVYNEGEITAENLRGAEIL